MIASVPLVATGITTTQLNFDPLVESLAAWLMAASGGIAAGLHLRLAARGGRPVLIRALWGVCGLSLIFGMILAALYGARPFAVLPMLDIPRMRAWHGTADALGFGLIGALAWNLLPFTTASNAPPAGPRP